MMNLEACINVLAGLNAKGQNRYEEAVEMAEALARDGNPAAKEAIGELRRRITLGEERGCDECNHWNGLDRRCSCGNRRIAWAWNDGWYAETY